MLTNITCLPPAFQYFVYGFFIIMSSFVVRRKKLSGLILINIGTALRALLAVSRAALWLVFAIVRLFRACFRINMRTDAHGGITSRQQIRRAAATLSALLTPPLTRFIVS